MKKTLQVAIDGPSGAGKSTVAKGISNSMHLEYIDTGAMYRALALKFIKEDFTDYEDKDILLNFLDRTNIDFSAGRIILDGEDITELIRTEEIGMLASKISALPEIRDYMVKLQRGIASNHDVIMDGRDVGTVILKDSDYKYYLTASLEERTRRRYLQLQKAGVEVPFEQVMEMLSKRDNDDMNREHSPLMKAENAIEVDCTSLSEEETINLIIENIKGKSDAL